MGQVSWRGQALRWSHPREECGFASPNACVSDSRQRESDSRVKLSVEAAYCSLDAMVGHEWRSYHHGNHPVRSRMRVIHRAARSRQTAHADPRATAETIAVMAMVRGATDSGAKVKTTRMTPSPKPPTKYRNETAFDGRDTVGVEKSCCASGCPTPA
jgi:hypothetical protein